MTPELTALAVLILMQMILGLAATAFVSKEVGNAWLFSSRNEAKEYRATLGGRMERARNNGFEAIALFAPLALALAVSGTATSATATAAWVYVAARAAYWVCYAADLVPWRTLVWFVGLFALLVMLWPLLAG